MIAQLNTVLSDLALPLGSKDGLIRALLTRARGDELALLERVPRPSEGGPSGIDVIAGQVWSWLAAKEHRALLTLWVEGYARSLVDATGA